MDIKNKNIVLSTITEGKITTLTIQNKIEDGSPTKLGHVLNYLPHGIIDKTITGLGGTTLELDCNRDSVVVEPLKFTAESKAIHPSLNNKYKVFNFAIPKKSVDFGLLVTDILLPAELEGKFNEYLAHCKKTKQPLKFICVSDQLGKLKEYINQSEHLKFEDFHLLIDEIDSMQLQSDFRNVMHHVMEIYKKHPLEKRTLLSATITKFHDRLNSLHFIENRTNIYYLHNCLEKISLKSNKPVLISELASIEHFILFNINSALNCIETEINMVVTDIDVVVT